MFFPQRFEAPPRKNNYRTQKPVQVSFFPKPLNILDLSGRICKIIFTKRTLILFSFHSCQAGQNGLTLIAIPIDPAGPSEKIDLDSVE
jgi:hypothetical protein